MECHYTKAGLYNEVKNIRVKMGLSHNEIGLDAKQYCINNNIKVGLVPFTTRGLRGMASIGNIPEEDVILLNSKRDGIEQNFDCGHELMHLYMHRNLRQKNFNCIDRVYAKQDEYIEWQANEGAAELFMPNYLFIPYVGESYRNMLCSSDILRLKNNLCAIFNVTKKVVEIRLESLKYEINQYAYGISYEKVEILSASQQLSRNIYIKSLNDIEKEMQKLEYKRNKYTSYYYNVY
jgi:Zn-dependent peptidase ImmA (M78 family)